METHLSIENKLFSWLWYFLCVLCFSFAPSNQTAYTRPPYQFTRALIWLFLRISHIWIAIKILTSNIPYCCTWISESGCDSQQTRHWPTYKFIGYAFFILCGCDLVVFNFLTKTEIVHNICEFCPFRRSSYFSLSLFSSLLRPFHLFEMIAIDTIKINYSTIQKP